ncbi:MAG TPA: winged helix-turn-helix domain-containing protein [Thermoanaerobaculia bacterium]|jgi:DNA-binding winged helix-turn-helix (wHTH) protein/Tfp pilus assembly protein PilF|nr:winged helix-turn-helix domain-containing protein [Thermoanaerobaculia bacterium]
MRERYRIADLTLDVEAVSLTRRNGEAVALPQLSFDLLVALARRAPAVVSGEELIGAVWNGAAVSDETLTQRVALLRKALGDEAQRPRYLRAVRGRGYQLVPHVARLPGEEELPRWPRAIAVAAAAVALVGLGVGLYYLLLAYGRAQTRSEDASAVATRTASVPELLARAGSYLRQHQESDNETAVELYRRALRLEPENPQALAGLSMALAQRAAKFNRGGEREQAVALARKALARDPRLGLAHHALGMALDTRGHVREAIAAYLRAANLEPDPTFALASAAYLLQVQGHLADALEANVHVAREGGDDGPQYLELQIAQTLALLGFDEAAEVWFERALELRPDNVFASASYAQMRLSRGRIQEADAIAARAIERGTRRPELPTIRGLVALMKGDEQRAKAFFTDALKIDPDSLRPRTRLLLLARRQPGGSADAALEQRYREMVLSIRQGRNEGDEWPDGAIDEMLLEAGFGHEEAALEALDIAINLGYRDDDWLLLDPMLADLRGNPEVTPRIEKIRRLVNAERQRVVGAPWLPPGFLKGNAARM